jgi:hypothetical protein
VDSNDSVHAYLLPTQRAAIPLARSVLVSAMLRDSSTLRFSLDLLPAALKAGAAHRALVGFATAVSMEYLGRVQAEGKRGGMDEGALAAIVPALLAPLEHAIDAVVESAESGTPPGVLRDAVVRLPVFPSFARLTVRVQLASYAALAALSRATPLTPAALRTLFERTALAGRALGLPASRVLCALLLLASPQTPVDKWSKKAVSAVLRLA